MLLILRPASFVNLSRILNVLPAEFYRSLMPGRLECHYLDQRELGRPPSKVISTQRSTFDSGGRWTHRFGLARMAVITKRRIHLDEQQHHEQLIKGITQMLKPILQDSAQAVYVYLDDTHKACNRKLATLLGYKSPKEWADAEAPLADVVEEDQPAVIDAYGKASEKLAATSLDIRVRNVTTNKIVKAKMIMVPIAFEGHIFALHFLSRV